MRQLFARMARIARSSAAVLIEGETGTGKEVVARAIHDASARAGRPFVVIDCGALPDSLLESELYGHAKGSFTGAAEARVGAIEAADGGTAFLDEIAELPLSMQPKLLRVLEARAIRRLGETYYRPIDVRFVSATHRDLGALVRRGTFREDLFFRLAVLPLMVPPLRQRAGDIPSLVQSFVPAEALGTFVPGLLDELSGRPWPGNVRELRNFVERVLALGPTEALALTFGAGEAQHAPPQGPPTVHLAGNLLSMPYKRLRESTFAQIEREYLRALLAQYRRNVSAAAQASGLNRSYLHRLIRRHAL
jgi:transcriptional regulator with GAF, ATPase, and Fis domain